MIPMRIFLTVHVSNELKLDFLTSSGLSCDFGWYSTRMEPSWLDSVIWKVSRCRWCSSCKIWVSHSLQQHYISLQSLSCNVVCPVCCWMNILLWHWISHSLFIEGFCTCLVVVSLSLWSSMSWNIHLYKTKIIWIFSSLFNCHGSSILFHRFIFMVLRLEAS